MPGPQPTCEYKNGQEAKLYARRLKFRQERAGEFRYPFGLLNVIHLLEGTGKRMPRRRPANAR